MKGIHYAIIIMSMILLVSYYIGKKAETPNPPIKKVDNENLPTPEIQPVEIQGKGMASVENEVPTDDVEPAKVKKAELDYYQSVSARDGQQLKRELHQLIKGHRVLKYSELWDSLRDLDAGGEESVVLIYKRTLRGVSLNGGDEGDWNREHLWPRAYGIGRSSIANTDLHHIRASDVRVNAKRGHLYFDETDGEDYGGRKYSYDQDSWEPPNEVKGDIARALFYMAVRYEAGEKGAVDLELADTSDFQKRQLGKLSVLLKWHKEDPVSDKEKERNNKIHRTYQGNRNPFIDHPEYADRIFSN